MLPSATQSRPISALISPATLSKTCGTDNPDCMIAARPPVSMWTMAAPAFTDAIASRLKLSKSSAKFRVS
jgi:hypothetical protein